MRIKRFKANGSTAKMSKPITPGRVSYAIGIRYGAAKMEDELYFL